MPLLLRFALRNLLRHPARSVATAFGVALGVAAVLATLSVGDNVRANLAATLEAATGNVDLVVTPGVGGRAVFDAGVPLEQAAGTPGVRRVSPVLEVRAEPLGDVRPQRDSVLPGVDSGFLLSGRETGVPEELPVALVAGRLPARGSGGIALPEAYAASRGIGFGARVGFASAVGELEFELVGLLDDASGIAGTNAGRVALVDVLDLQRAVRLEGRVSALEVTREAGVGVEALRERLAAELGEALTVSPPAGAGDLAAGVVDTLQAGLRILAATLMALSGFLAYNTFAAATVERRREYALLRLICMTRAQVQAVALVEALTLSALGIALGLALGWALSFAVTSVNAWALGFEFRTLVVPTSSVLLAALVGVAVAVLAGILPARAASRTPPVAALRSAGEEGTSGRPLLGSVSLVLGVVASVAYWPGVSAVAGAAVAMTFLLTGIVLVTPLLLPPTVRLLTPPLVRAFGIAGRVGAGFTARSATRNSVAVGVVTVGITLTVGVGAMVEGINREIRVWVESAVVGDLFVSTPIGFPADFEARVAREVPEIGVTSGVGLRVARFEPDGGARGRSVAMVLVDPARFHPDTGFGSFLYVRGQGDDAAGYAALRDGSRLLAANTVRDRFGIGAGDTVRIRTSDGFREFPVEAVVVDFTAGGEAFVGSLDDLPLFGGGTPDLYVMNAAPGVPPAVARERLLAAFPELYLDATSNEAYRERILTLTSQSFTTTNSLLALTVFIAALGVANTLGMNLTSRSHEIGVLRTIGFTRGGVARMVQAEGIVVTTLGTVMGILCGVLLAQVITAGANALTGYLVTPAYPASLILTALAASPLVGFLASLGPARRAARLQPALAVKE